MIAHTTWRDLFYKLAEAHPDCLMLNFTVKVQYGHGDRRRVLPGSDVMLCYFVIMFESGGNMESSFSVTWRIELFLIYLENNHVMDWSTSQLEKNIQL